LIPFLEAFDPDRSTSMEILRGFPGAGADLIEIGCPFTDPMADGPTVQRAGQRGLKAGATLAGTLQMVRDFRAGDAATPIILMGYYNPILSYGANFCADAAAAGVDGLIIVDVPPEEADEIEPQARAAGLDMIRLIAPTTDDARMIKVLAATSGFIYYVVHHRHHRHPQRDRRRIGRSHSAYSQTHQFADRDWLWLCVRRNRLLRPHALPMVLWWHQR